MCVQKILCKGGVCFAEKGKVSAAAVWRYCCCAVKVNRMKGRKGEKGRTCKWEKEKEEIATVSNRNRKRVFVCVLRHSVRCTTTTTTHRHSFCFPIKVTVCCCGGGGDQSKTVCWKWEQISVCLSVVTTTTGGDLLLSLPPLPWMFLAIFIASRSVEIGLKLKLSTAKNR